MYLQVTQNFQFAIKMYQLVYRKVFILKIDISIYIKNGKKTGVEFSKENVKTYVFRYYFG